MEPGASRAWHARVGLFGDPLRQQPYALAADLARCIDRRGDVSLRLSATRAGSNRCDSNVAIVSFQGQWFALPKLNLASMMLTAVLVDGHRSSGRHVVAVGLPIHGYFDNSIQTVQF